MKEEELTYEILVKEFRRQDRLIAEGKMQKPQRVIRDFTPEEMEVIKRGRTAEIVFKELEEKYGL